MEGADVAAWKGVQRGQGRIVLVEGESGVGKSRLADEFLRWVVAEGGTVLRGRSYDRRAGIPYEPVVEGAPRCARRARTGRHLARMAGRGGAAGSRSCASASRRLPGRPGSRATEGWRLFEGVAQLLAAIAAERPVAIVIDDLQWCDEDSCNLLRFLTRRLERSPVLWLGMLTPGRGRARCARVPPLPGAPRQGSTPTSSRWGRSAKRTVWQLVREMGHVSVPTGGRRLAARLYRITAGNPFYVIELLKTMFAQGLLAMDAETGEWTWCPREVGAGREVPVSQTVQDVIAERVDRLSHRAARRADHDRGERRRAAARTSSRTCTGSPGCTPRPSATRWWIAIWSPRKAAAYRCIHPVIAHMVRDGLTASRRQEVHRALALALELVHGGRTSSSRSPGRSPATRSGAASGSWRTATRCCAAESAVARYAYAEALSWLDLAASSARGAVQAEAVDQLTAEVMERAGWSEAPRRAAAPVTREIVSEDLDLRVRG